MPPGNLVGHDPNTTAQPGGSAYAHSPAVILNAGRSRAQLLHLAVLGLYAVSMGSAATASFGALAATGHLTASVKTLGPALGTLVLAVLLRLAFLRTWSLRRARHRLQRETRARLDDALAAGEAPDLPTLCWCLAVAAGCSNQNPRPLTRARLLDIESRLGIRLPRRWEFTTRIGDRLAVAGRPLPLTPGRYRVLPSRYGAIIPPVAAVALLLIAFPLAMCAIVTASPGALMIPLLALSLVGFTVTTGVGAWIWRSRCRHRIEIRSGGGVLAHVPGRDDDGGAGRLDPDAFELVFAHELTARLRSFKLGRALRLSVGRRLRVLAPEPWGALEIRFEQRPPGSPGERAR
jgi:hypothetical protein